MPASFLALGSIGPYWIRFGFIATFMLIYLHAKYFQKD